MQLAIPQIELVPPGEGEDKYGCPVCGRQHLRVTSMLSRVIPKFALVPWAERVTRQGAIAVYEQTGMLPNNERELAGAIAELGLNADQQRDSGADRGTVVHQYLNRYIETGTVEAVTDFDARYRPYLMQLAKFLIDYEPEFLASELRLAHCRLDYAGTTDGIVVIHRQPPRRNKPIDLTGKRCLFDAKSNKDGRVYAPDVYYQLAGYELAYRELGGEPNDHQIVVAVGTDKYQLAVSYFEPESFEPLVNFYADQQRQMARNPNARKPK